MQAESKSGLPVFRSLPALGMQVRRSPGRAIRAVASGDDTDRAHGSDQATDEKVVTERRVGRANLLTWSGRSRQERRWPRASPGRIPYRSWNARLKALSD